MKPRRNFALSSNFLTYFTLNSEHNWEDLCIKGVIRWALSSKGCCILCRFILEEKLSITTHGKKMRKNNQFAFHSCISLPWIAMDKLQQTFVLHKYSPMFGGWLPHCFKIYFSIESLTHSLADTMYGFSVKLIVNLTLVRIFQYVTCRVTRINQEMVQFDFPW